MDGKVEVWACGAMPWDVVGYRTMEILRELDSQNFPTVPREVGQR